MVCDTIFHVKSDDKRTFFWSYVMGPYPVEESSKVKMFDKFIDDLEKLMNP